MDNKEKAINRTIYELFTNGFGDRATRLAHYREDVSLATGYCEAAIRPMLSELFDAGLAHAQQWVEIKSEDDLPKEDGVYLWRDANGHLDAFKFRLEAKGKDWLVQEWVAYTPIPPFTPKGEQEQ